MSRRYMYSLVRCVPDPRTGEFINIGAIAGDADTGDWAVRQVSSERRAIKLAGPGVLEAVHGFLARAQEAIEMQEVLLDEDADRDYLGSDWLDGLHRDHRNTVQLAPPTPMLAETAEDALDLIFERMIIDPVSQPRGYVTKKAVLADLRVVYQSAGLAPNAVRPRAEVFVGANVHSGVDFAVANGVAVQLTQAWSFQRAGIEEVSTQVKAWAYALARVRAGEEARVVAGDQTSAIRADVDLQVVVARPRSKDQEQVFREATQVFDDLGATVSDSGQANRVGQRAAELLSRH